MSSLRLMESTETLVGTRRSKARHQTGAQYAAAPAVGGAVRVRRKSDLMEHVTVYLLTFLLVAGLVYMVTHLAGHVMLEKARREAISSQKRIEIASKACAVLKDEVARLSTEGAVSKWAADHQFVDGEAVLAHTNGSQL